MSARMADQPAPDWWQGRLPRDAPPDATERATPWQRTVWRSPQRKRDPEITPAMADPVRQRVEDAGGKLVVWAVLHEDIYETRYGDGLYLHVHGLALNSKDAHALAELAGNSEWVKWHVKMLWGERAKAWHLRRCATATEGAPHVATVF